MFAIVLHLNKSRTQPESLKAGCFVRPFDTIIKIHNSFVAFLALAISCVAECYCLKANVFIYNFELFACSKKLLSIARLWPV